MTLYTPGSEAGVPLNVIGSLQAPTLSWETDEETIRDEIEGTVEPARPGRDRGRPARQPRARPPLEPARAQLARRHRPRPRHADRPDPGSPAAQARRLRGRRLPARRGGPKLAVAERARRLALVRRLGPRAALDPAVLLRTEDGKPRAAVIYLAHLSDQERQLVVTLVLSRLITWMRGQSGTSELRGLVYLDEVMGFAPPTAMPPSKKPILTLLKQARAFGIGMVVATQNPVDLDYKAMANAGTLVHRPPADRAGQGARARGLARPPAASTSRARHGDRRPRAASVPAQRSPRRSPALLDPLGDVVPARTADEGADRDADARQRRPGGGRVVRRRPRSRSPTTRARSRRRRRRQGARPLARPRRAVGAEIGADPAGKRLQAFLAARVSLRFDDTKAELDTTQEWEALYGPLDAGLDLDRETEVDYDDRDLRSEAARRRRLRAPERPARQGGVLPRRRPRDPAAPDRRRRRSSCSATPSSTLYSRPGETREQFAARADEAAKAAADAETAKIRDRLEAKRDRLERALETAPPAGRAGVRREAAARAPSSSPALGSVVGVLLGGKADTRTIARAGRALGGAASRRGMSTRAAERKESAEEKAELAEADLAELEQEILDEVAEIDGSGRRRRTPSRRSPIRLEAGDVRVVETTLVWVPTA